MNDNPTSDETAPAAMPLGHRFLDRFPELCTEWRAAAPPDPRLIALNEALAVELGLDPEWLRSPDGVAVLGGSVVPDGAQPVAMVYAGHQFGGYSPRLGDGRALLLGELTGPDGSPVDVHLKGSGRTPYARGGDGKAVLGPMLREFLVAESMHALGIPTTRALAVVATGEPVRRDGVQPGALLVRVASSHLRVGTFEYAVRLGTPGLVERLVDEAIERHHPSAAVGDRPRALALLDAVVDAQATLVAHWMLVGFIHGVMNTDNMTISGETIDYGPCAFLDRYDPAAVFSSIDEGGRYAYGNQPRIALWDLARLAETLLGLIAPDPETAVALATEVLDTFPRRYREQWQTIAARKLGLGETGDASLAGELADELLAMAQRADADFTSTFRALAPAARGESAALEDLLGAADELARWLNSWSSAIAASGRSMAEAASRIEQVNPLHIPRNQLLDEALEAAHAGDLAPFEALLAAVRQPFDADGIDERFRRPAPLAFSAGFRTFCGT